MNQEKRIVKTLGRRVRKYRLQLGWSQMFLAAESGLDKSYIGSIERAEVNPSIKKIANIADALGVHVADLLDDRRQSKN
ncbi:MAG: helix-turn-helix domain-containing protein [Candidatus Obscuribacterales bacterium]|nr:helix-turn-helix domain-containing protein [Candidatus Obscuribacterales bacterium]